MYSSGFRLFATGILACTLLSASEPNDALSVYQAGNFEAAIPLLQSAVANDPDNAELQAALLSSLVYQGRVDDALAAAERDRAKFPGSAEVTAARGECAFYMGDMPQAERLFHAALQLKDDAPRALLGLARLLRAASFYRSGRLMVLKAHEIAPEDALITQAFLRYLAPDRQRAQLGPFAAAHPWLYRNYQDYEESRAALEPAVAGKKLFEADQDPHETTLKFSLLMRDAQHARGVGLDLKIDKGHALRMLFDTGASGILVKQSAVDKAGLEHLGAGKSWGVGDAGTRNIFAAVADTCEVGGLQFRNCLVRALEGKRNVSGDEDGLIGADFFQDYVVEIDFQKRLLHLKPLPPRPDSPQGYDRAVPPDEASFTPVYRFGHQLMISTQVNRKETGLFLLDTGASMSNIDSTFARLSTRLHGEDWLHVQGVSGAVKNVYEADKAELQFGHFRQNNVGLIAFNLNNAPEHQDVRMAGVLGIPVLAMFRLTIDYRNGLVNFDYLGPK